MGCIICNILNWLDPDEDEQLRENLKNEIAGDMVTRHMDIVKKIQELLE